MGANVLSLWKKASTNGKMLVLVAGIRQELSHSRFLPYDKLSYWAERGDVCVSHPGKQGLRGICHLSGLHYRQLTKRSQAYGTRLQQNVSLQKRRFCYHASAAPLPQSAVPFRLGKTTTVSRF